MSRPAKRAARCASSPPVTVPEPPTQRSASSEPSPASTDPCAKTWSRRASAARAAPLRAPRRRWVRPQARAHDSLPWGRLVSSASRVPPATDAEHPSPAALIAAPTARPSERPRLQPPLKWRLAMMSWSVDCAPAACAGREVAVFSRVKMETCAALLGCSELPGGQVRRFGVAAVVGSCGGLASAAGTPAARGASSAPRAES